MYKYLLTDGKIDVIACELEPLKEIDLAKTQPGSKVRVYGPVEVRRGVWMLKRGNVELLWTNQDPKMIGKCSFLEVNRKLLQ